MHRASPDSVSGATYFGPFTLVPCASLLQQISLDEVMLVGKQVPDKETHSRR